MYVGGAGRIPISNTYSELLILISYKLMYLTATLPLRTAQAARFRAGAAGFLCNSLCFFVLRSI